MIDIHDYDIALIEKKIRWIYNRKACDYPQHDCLLSLRKDMINQRVLAHQEEIIPDIIAFNNALTDALHKMYDRAFQILNNMKSSINDNDEVMLTAHCFFSDEYPKLHPVQGDDRRGIEVLSGFRYRYHGLHCHGPHHSRRLRPAAVQ